MRPQPTEILSGLPSFSRESRKEQLSPYYLWIRRAHLFVAPSISDLLCAIQARNTSPKAFGSTAICANARSHLAYNHRYSANCFKAVKGAKGWFVQRPAPSLTFDSVSTDLGTVISSSEVPESSALTNSPSPPPIIAPAGIEATAVQAKERLSGWGG